jgi:uncharacterized protein YfaS (alpha-2-macroglobulin family)
VEVRLTLILPQIRHFVLINAPYPAGFEPVDTSAATVPQLEFGEMVPDVSPLRRLGWWYDPFERRELRDEQAVFFANSLASGTYRVSYMLRAGLPGTYHALGAWACELYFPEVWGRTACEILEIVPAN